MNHYVYLIGSIKNSKLKTYVGYTKNLRRRLSLHNSGRGAKSTRGRIWKFYYYKKYYSKEKAMHHEYILKKNRLKRKVIVTKFLSTNQL